MKRLLLAGVATVGLAFATLPASAQITPTPGSPPITTPQPETAPSEQEVAPSVTTAPQPAPVQAIDQPPPAPQAATAAPTESVQSQTTAEPQAAENAVLATPASATSVCEQRTTSVHFGARGSALSQQNRNAIQYAADAASVCDLQTVTIVDSAQGRTSSRRAAAVRATLIAQGIPAERITVSEEINADADAASTGRLDVRMAFAGVADGGNPATAAAAPVPTPVAPAVAPQAPDMTTPPPVEGVPAGEEDMDPTPST